MDSTNPHNPVPSKRSLLEPLVILAFLAGWFVLQMWVLPNSGAAT
jgi:hypothetical protein